MLRNLLFLALSVTSFHTLAAQEVRYTIRFPNAVHHEAEIEVRFDNIPSATLELRMPAPAPAATRPPNSP